MAVALALIVGLACLLLTAASWLRGAEYDEQYTLFLTAGVARPVWPSQPFPAGTVTALQSGHGTLVRIAHDLRATDVHPPLYFWLVSLWRQVAGPSLFAARLLSVLLSLVSLAAVARIARATGVPAVPAMLLTLGCYGFAYTGAIARGFALAQALTLCGTAVVIHAARDRRVAPALLAGLLLGAAPAANYLAGFVAAAGLVWLAWRRLRAPRVSVAAWLGASLWLPCCFGSSLRSVAAGMGSFRRSRCSPASRGWRAIPWRRCLAGCRFTAGRGRPGHRHFDRWAVRLGHVADRLAVAAAWPAGYAHPALAGSIAPRLGCSRWD